MSKELRRLIIFGAPLFVGVINIFHPAHFQPTGVYESLHDKVNWWIVLHILNLFGFALLGLAAYLLFKDQHGIAATIAGIAIAIFVPTYTGFDSIIGIGTGILIRYANGVPTDQLVVLDPTINAFWTNHVSAMLAMVGSIAWGLGMSLCAVSFTEPRGRKMVLVLGLIAGLITGWGYTSSTFGTPLWWIAVLSIGVISTIVARLSISVGLLIVSGILFGTTHVVPYGPLGMACFMTAVALLESAQRKIQIHEMMETVPSRG